MAKIHKISGYVVDIDGIFEKHDLENDLGVRDLLAHHLHVETADIGEWEDEHPLNFDDCDLAECEKWFSKEPEAYPVKHGRWVKVADLCGIEILKCSVCGKERPRTPGAYCCDCGAKMDGE